MQYNMTQIPFAMLYRGMHKDISEYVAANVENEKQAEKLSRQVFIRLREHYGRPTFYVFGHLLWIVTNSQMAKSKHAGRARRLSKRVWRFLFGSIEEHRQYRHLIQMIEKRLDAEKQSEFSEQLPQLSKKQKRVLQRYVQLVNSTADCVAESTAGDAKSQKQLVGAVEALNPETDHALLREACRWLVVLEEAGVKARDLKAFDAWLQQDKQHKQAFKSLETTWLNMSAVLQ